MIRLGQAILVFLRVLGCCYQAASEVRPCLQCMFPGGCGLSCLFPVLGSGRQYILVSLQQRGEQEI